MAADCEAPASMPQIISTIEKARLDSGPTNNMIETRFYNQFNAKTLAVICTMFLRRQSPVAYVHMRADRQQLHTCAAK